MRKIKFVDLEKLVDEGAILVDYAVGSGHYVKGKGFPHLEIFSYKLSVPIKIDTNEIVLAIYEDNSDNRGQIISPCFVPQTKTLAFPDKETMDWFFKERHIKLELIKK